MGSLMEGIWYLSWKLYDYNYSCDIANDRFINWKNKTNKQKYIAQAISLKLYFQFIVSNGETLMYYNFPKSA